MNTTDTFAEHRESPEQFETRVISSVYIHAAQYFYMGSERMPYHNDEHMFFVHDKVVEYGEYCKENGQEVDMFALRLAAILHDANYHEDLSYASSKFISRGFIKEPFESKEAYSAWSGDILLESYGVSLETRKKVKSYILATDFQNDPETLEEKILVRADLDNIAGPRSTFLENTLKLVREAELMSGPKNPFERISFSYNVLQEYLSKDLCFGDFDRDFYYKTFKKPALANTARITEQNIKTAIRLLGKRALSLLPSLGSND